MNTKMLRVFYSNQSRLFLGFECPLCSRNVQAETIFRSCPFCHFHVGTQAALGRVVDMAYEILSETYEMNLPRKHVISQKSDIDEVSRLLFLKNRALIQFSSYWLQRLNDLDLKRKRLSFWICTVIHELLHYDQIVDAVGVRKYRTNQLEHEIKVRRKLFYATKNYGKLYSEYRWVVSNVGLSGIELHAHAERCAVFGCVRYAIGKCTRCGRSLCDKHVDSSSHYPCKRLGSNEVMLVGYLS